MIILKRIVIWIVLLCLILGGAWLHHKANDYLASHSALLKDALQKELGFPVQFKKITLGFKGFSFTDLEILDLEKPLPFMAVRKLHCFPKWIPLLIKGKIEPSSMVLEELSLRVRWEKGKDLSLLALNGAEIPSSVDYPVLLGFLAQQQKISLVDASIFWDVPDHGFRQRCTGEIRYFDSLTQSWHCKTKNQIALSTGLVLPELILKMKVQSDQKLSLTVEIDPLCFKGDFLRNPAQGSWDLKSTLEGKKVAIQNLRSYYTIFENDIPLLQWFSKAFKDGMLETVDLALEGPLKAPILKGTLHYQGVHFKYHEPWPAITEASGTIAIHQQRIQVSLLEGRLGDLPLERTTALIRWGDRKGTLIEIEGSLQSTLEQGLAFLESSPLSEKLAKPLKVLSPKGPMDLSLALRIPLDHTAVGVQGTLYTGAATLEGLKGLKIEQALSGEANVWHFSESNLDVCDLHLKLFDKPLIASLGLRILPKQIQIDLKTDQPFQAKLSSTRDTMTQWSIDSRDLKGTITLPRSSSNRLEGNFEHCVVHTSLNDQNTPFDFLSLSNKPAVSFYCKNLYYEDRLFGELSFELLPKNNAYAIQNLSLDNKHFSWMGEGLWSIKDQSLSTTLRGSVVGVDIGKGLSDLGYASMIRESSGRLHYDWTWPGHPWALDRNGLKGSFDLKLDKGRILGVDPGLGRVMGLLNFESIKRRLQLDFSDLFKKGFVFDTLQGKFNCDKGILSTDALLINGPSAKMNLQGKANLNTKAIHLNLQVQPHLGSGLPIAAAVAAGHPAVGAGLWIVNRLTRSSSKRLTKQEYQVGGTWDEPKIENAGSS